MLLVVVLVVWIVLLPLATVVGLYVLAPRLRRSRDGSKPPRLRQSSGGYRPRRLSTYGIVLRRIRRSSHNDQLAP